MIIKSMSRKTANFGQLVSYMEDGRQDHKFTLKNNLFSNTTQKIKKEFENNASYIKQRKNGIYMYHEVISITKSTQITEDKQKEILREITLRYIEKRANNNLTYGVLHDDKEDNLHYHLLISSNELEDSKKHRLSKAEFDKIKKELELRVLEKYPELEQKKVINKKAQEKLSNKGAELKRRTGKTNQRDSVKIRLKTVFEKSKTKQDFFTNIEKENLEIYVRGNTVGVIDKTTNRKHRLKTLGMQEDFTKISSIVEKSETINDIKQERKEEIQEHRKPQTDKVSIKNNTYIPEPEKNTENQKEITKRKEELKEHREVSRKNEKINKTSQTKNR